MLIVTIIALALFGTGVATATGLIKKVFDLDKL